MLYCSNLYQGANGYKVSMLSLNDKTGTLVGNIYARDIIPTKISRMSLQRDTPKVTVEKKKWTLEKK